MSRPGIALVAQAPPDHVRAILFECAPGLGFQLQPTSDWTCSARQGNLVASIFLGAFIAYCDFELRISVLPHDGNTLLEIQRNTPWWTGLIGVNRVKKRAVELADAVVWGLQARSFPVLHRADT